MFFSLQGKAPCDQSGERPGELYEVSAGQEHLVSEGFRCASQFPAPVAQKSWVLVDQGNFPSQLIAQGSSCQDHMRSDT